MPSYHTECKKTLNSTQQCRRRGLRINPKKTTIMPFTKKEATPHSTHWTTLCCKGFKGLHASAMKTCLTAAMEALLDLLPLYLQVRKTAFSSAFQILNFYKAISIGRTGNMKILSTDGLSNVAHLPMNAMKTEYVFAHNYKAVYIDRETWARGGGGFSRGALQWYIDGSKMTIGVAEAGIYGPNCHISIPMDVAPSILQTEVFAINLCADSLINRKKGIKGATIDILTDSRAALLARDNHVTLWWVPGHKGIRGNEVADEFTKKEVRAPPTGPVPRCGVTANHIKGLIRHWEDGIKSSYWSGMTGLVQAKKFITYSPQRIRAVLSLDKGNLTTLIGLLSGHCQFRYHLSLIGKTEDDGCRFCMKTAETAEHIMCACPAVGYLRQKFLGGVYHPQSD
ncbi:uncharacterized protein LOC105201308 [Solenopsis invicta]|uniref:uncharacterized protein LOC105201308 n=1 Tax=Solenopsis invicta TaxID=13686 RepID=UPI0005959758|nr:uncharacterized protein LOC105201308 [Solenopsis invicta]